MTKIHLSQLTKNTEVVYEKRKKDKCYSLSMYVIIYCI